MTETDPIWHEFRNAVYGRAFTEAEALLRKIPQLISITNGIGETALHFLAVENNVEGVSWLHSKGADINTKNHFGIPVIFEVAQLGYKDLLIWFVGKEADIYAKDKDGQDIFEFLHEFDKDEMAEWIRNHDFST